MNTYITNLAFNLKQEAYEIENLVAGLAVQEQNGEINQDDVEALRMAFASMQETIEAIKGEYSI